MKLVLIIFNAPHPSFPRSMMPLQTYFILCLFFFVCLWLLSGPIFIAHIHIIHGAWTVGQGYTLRDNCPFPAQQITIAPNLVVELHAQLPSPCWHLASLGISQTWACCHNHCELIQHTAMSTDTVSL